MPISEIQARVLRTIAGNRCPDSYLAGATVLHRKSDTPRFSKDLDFFHDIEDKVALSAELDAATLTAAGYEFSWLLRTPSFHRGIVVAESKRLKIEWAQDSAFRFYPVQEDELCGYRLHEADAAINKLLALAGRTEIRDFVDLLHLHEKFLSLGTLAWTACGKDPGFTPEFLLDHANRHTCYVQSDLDRLDLREPLDLQEQKKRWITALQEGRSLIAALPADEVGCFYVDDRGTPTVPDPYSPEFKTLKRHYGSTGGAWPVVS